jgi:1-acyl-sn-glycerol-3-phosphate acyltransferase
VKVGRARLPAAPAALRFVLKAPSTPGGVEPAVVESKVGVDYPTAWARRSPARVARRVLHETVMEPVVLALARPSVHGLDRLAGLDESQPVIFAANHHSHVDTPLLLRTLPRPWRDELFVGAAADYFFPNRLTGAASALVLNAIPIERTRVSRRSALDAAALIEVGWSMLIYPEGGRSPDGWGQEFRGGAAYLSIRCGVPVVPVHLSGTDKVLPKGRRLPTPGRTQVTFGSPLSAAEGEDSRRLAVRLERSVAALADEVSTDWYSARRRYFAGTTPALTGPDGPSWRRAWARSATTPAAKRAAGARRWPPR